MTRNQSHGCGYIGLLLRAGNRFVAQVNITNFNLLLRNAQL